MDKNIKVLCIKGKSHWIGIDLYEIKKVIHKSSDNIYPDKFIKDSYSHNGKFYTMKSFFCEEDDECNSVIIIESLPQHDEIILGVSGEVDIIEVPLSQIIIMPEYIRKRQQNPYTWGLIKSIQKPIVLVTFSYLYKKEE